MCFVLGSSPSATTSHDTLSWLLGNLDCRIVFFDVNLRKQFYGKDCIIAGLHVCSILKMNDEELPIIVVLAGINPMLGGEGEDSLGQEYPKEGVSC